MPSGRKYPLTSHFTPGDFALDWLAIGLATLAYFIIGFLWYGPLFGRRWAKELNIDMPDKPDMKGMLKPIALNVFGNFLLVFVLFNVMMAFTEATWVEDGEVLTLGMATQGAFWVWLGFFLPAHLNRVAWEKNSWTLAAINLSNALVSLIVASIIFVYV